MSSRPLHRTVVVTDPIGIHTRVAVAVAEIVHRSRSRVKLWVDPAYRAEGTEVIQILGLAAPSGSQVHLEAVGPDAEAVLDALEPVFADFEKQVPCKNSKG
ncbi:MAG: HPr family phosphocarrier protein [Pirellulales bacterium]|nr:HPr family phosphocarrier protein [Pirellulales bacterium]